MTHGHVFDLAYFIALAIHHKIERHRKGVISIGLYVTRLAQYFNLLNTTAQASFLTLIAEQEDLEDITDDVPPPHEDPPSQTPPIHCPVHAAISIFDISEGADNRHSGSHRALPESHNSAPHITRAHIESREFSRTHKTTSEHSSHTSSSSACAQLAFLPHTPALRFCNTISSIKLCWGMPDESS
ncbi:hypothetical protein GOBAR_AA35058 [Gossypium barbadense]|uniref:Uncharacterized protein n=1 Tax=Gossypium barbadense TaxID=3634 RepID=A0A2P5W3I6_GOSBA|nr:hypothetical protein GOBAR_AA35058 [Gossypium barbadense]